MYFVLAATLIVAIIFFIKEQKDWGDLLNSLQAALTVAAVTLILSSIFTFLLTCVVYEAYEEDRLIPIETTETKLIALNDNMGITGAHYLCSGYINEELKYAYLYEVPGKGITSDSIKADECYIVESKKAKLVTTIYAIDTNWFVNFLTFDSALQKTEYTLFVPNGSIVAAGKYEIDLE